MNRLVKKVAILGAGIMGSRIACHFANIGMDVLLLDMADKDPAWEEIPDRGKDKRKEIRNRLVNRSLDETVKSDPSPLYKKDFALRIKTGNFEDDLSFIKDCDWIIEAVVEDAEIKRSLYSEVENFRKSGTLITSNTSGIPLQALLEGRSPDFRRNFCGTHFFNPPRYLRLLEIIPTTETDPSVVDFLMRFGDVHLGKRTILCKDTPAFIANRIGIFGFMKVLAVMKTLGLNIDEVDKLTGTIAGRPKSATFRTSDIVGLDTLTKVASNLYNSLTDDENRELFRLPEFIRELEKRSWLGEKSKQGFYKKIKNKKGESVILTLDPEDFEYKPRKKTKFSTLDTAKSIDNLKDRLPVLYNGKDKAGEFYRLTFTGLFHYISGRIPETADELYKIDDALCAGFGWETGPFATWDILGVEKVIGDMEKYDNPPAAWVYEMLQKGYDSFYRTENRIRKYYDIISGSYQAIPGSDGIIILDNLRKNNLVWKNPGCSLIDIGDGILNVEFHTKMNTMGAEVIEGINKGIETAEKDFRGVVIGNDGQNFTAGANLGIIFMLAIEQEYDELDLAISTFQHTMMRTRYSCIPVVVAPFGISFGGGCEISLHADHVQAAAETYIGLVEVGVGLVPSGGGTKEMARRISDRYESGDIELNVLQNTFMHIGMGKVATSAWEAKEMNYLRPGDGITINRDRLTADAKAAALRIADAGYIMPNPAHRIKVQGRTGLALFHAGIHGMKVGNYITDHDVKIAEKIAWIMCGGDLSAPAEVSEQYLLDLEREAFLSLCSERKTLERIEAILQGRKPLRN